MVSIDHSKILLLFLFLFSSMISHSICYELCSPYDKNVLLGVKSKLGNPRSLGSWQNNTDCCSEWWRYNLPPRYNFAMELACDNNGNIVSLMIMWADDIFLGDLLPALADLGYLQSITIAHIFNTSTQIPPEYCTRLTNLEILTISDSNLTGSIPECLGQLTNLMDIDLNINRLTGEIPQSLTQKPNLRTLNLGNNRLSGMIPEFLTSNNALYSIFLAGNSLSGPIPPSIQHLSNLSKLLLTSNQLTGPIPPGIGYIRTLKVLQLSNNKLSGSIPESFGSLPDGIGIQLGGNQLTGPIPKSMSQLDLWYFDVSKNNLTCDASFLFRRDRYFTEMINLSSNKLKFNFSNVECPQYLVQLNISHNKIYGSIPQEFARMPVMDVSYNRLCGPIPSGGNLQQQSPSNFAHNYCLCGPPLEEPCK